MEVSEKEIEKIDYIIERLIQYESTVDSNDLHISGHYDEYNDDDKKIEKDFNIIRLVFEDLNIGELASTKEGNYIKYDSKVLRFKKEHGSYKNYLLKIKEQSQEKELEQKSEEKRRKLKDKIDVLNYESLKHKKTIREQEDRIRDLTEQLTFINLLKSYWWVIGIGFGFGLAIAKLF